MDLTKCPAPWRVADAGLTVSTIVDDNEFIVMNVPRQFAERICLWRNAEDVMMRRGWHPARTTAWTDPDKWYVEFGAASAEVGDSHEVWERWLKTIGDGFSCPFTALVEAHEWMKANVDQKQAP
jgi:hypothetical protein